MPIRTPYKSTLQRQRGAALLVLLTMLVLASSYLLVKRLNSSVGLTEKNNQTLEIIENIKEALLGFAEANNRLPCPAIPASSGQEDPLLAGTCTVQYGFVPAVTLGISGATNQDNLLVDAWGNPIRYNVTAISAQAFTVGPIPSPATGDLRVCITAACSGFLINDAPVVLVSMGADGALAPTPADQGENGETRISPGNVGPLGIRYWVSSDPDFVSHAYSAVSGSEFDDLVRWISPPEL